MARLLLVEARFYEDIVDELVRGACGELKGHDVSHVSVAGAFEAPSVIAMDRQSPLPFEGYIVLGCVVRGETPHFEYVCQESARGLMTLSLTYALAIGYGILTTDTKEQAWERASVGRANRGGHAARACLGVLNVRDQLRRFHD